MTSTRIDSGVADRLVEDLPPRVGHGSHGSTTVSPASRGSVSTSSTAAGRRR